MLATVFSAIEFGEAGVLTLFTWGYWGWGNASREFVRAVDSLERRRGFAPPMFVDIRLRRSGRAKGFAGTAFERLVSRGRYHWMPCLGNRSIDTGERNIHIVCPAASKELLHLAVRCKKENRRVLFFCACEYPRQCHRRIVGGLVLKAAVKLNKHVEIVEWPGGKALHVNMPVRREASEAVLGGCKSVHLGKRTKPREVLCLPWGSVVELRGGAKRVSIVTGPAKYHKGWFLPVLDKPQRPDDSASLRGRSGRFRKEHALESRQA